MSPLLGPILAQLVTLAVSDRTEARYVRAFDTAYAEAGTYPRVGLNFGWRHLALNLGYGPLLTVTPLESADRKLLVSQNVGGTVAYRYGFQHTTLFVMESAAYNEVNFREQALAGPAGTPPATNPGAVPAGMTTPAPAGSMTGATPGPQPAPGTSVPIGAQTRAFNQSIATFTSTTTLGMNAAISAAVLVGGSAGYTVNRTKAEGQELPTTSGPIAEGHANYRISRSDALTTSLVTQYVATSQGNNAWLAFANQIWTHSLSLRTTTRLGAGLSITRNSQTDGLIFWSIYPNFNASINQVVPAGRSTFAFAALVASAPVLDPIRAAVDPGISLSSTASWGWGRLFSGITAGSAVSLAQQRDNGAFNAVYATFNTSYRLAAGLSADTGLRGFWQSVAGHTEIPASLAGYVGFTFGALTPLARGQ
jgi:hypothetical protein